MADLKRKFMEMKVADLRRELDSLGLEKTGVKTVLVDRLVKHFESIKEIVKVEEDEQLQENGNESGGETEVKDEEETANDPDNEGVTTVVEEMPADNVPESKVEDGMAEGDEAMVVEESHESETDTTEQIQDVDECAEEVEDKDQGADTAESYENEGSNENEESLKTQEDNTAENLESEQPQDVEQMETETEVKIEERGEEEASNVEASGEAEEVEESEGDALNITVEENEVLEMEQHGVKQQKEPENANEKPPESESTEKCEEHEQDNSSISTTSNNEAEKSDKTGEELKDEGKKESERHTILVTGLSSDTTANDLKTFFRKYGKIGRIKIMTNTRIPGSQRFAHVSAPSLDDLNNFLEKLNGVELKGKSIKLSKAPEDGSVSKSYEIAMATAQEDAATQADKKSNKVEGDDGKGETADRKSEKGEGSKDKCNTESSSEIEVVQETSGKEKAEASKEGDKKKAETSDKKKDVKESEKSQGSEEKKSSSEKGARAEKSHRSRKESHDRQRNEDHIRAPPRPFRRGGGRDPGDFRRRAPPIHHRPIEKVHRDRPPIGRGHTSGGGRRRSPHAQLTFDQIREIRDEQRRRDVERRKREEERERAAELERQKRLEYQNYVEFKQLEREREKLRLERERIEREKLELIKLERERQKAERDRIEREKEELRRAKMNIEHSHRFGVKRSFEDDERRRSSSERKKPYINERARIEPGKGDSERKVARERYERERVGTSSISGRSRSPDTREVATVSRESRRDVWARGTAEIRDDRTRSSEQIRRRDSDSLKSTDRRGREAPSRTAVGSSEPMSRYAVESVHSSNRATASSSKRSSDRYDERSSAREPEWIQRPSYLSSSSLGMPISSSASSGRDSWPLSDRKIEAWDTSRLPARTEQWISGVGATVAGGRAALPPIPPAPIYSHQATAGLNLPSTGLGLGGYTSERYDGYKGPFHHLRRF